MSAIKVQGRVHAAVAAAGHAAIIAVAIFGAPLAAAADTITIAWNPSPESEVRGYVVHVGTRPGVVAETADVGNVGVYTYRNATPGVIYYFSVSAYGDNGLTSPRSSEIMAAARGGGGEVPPGAIPQTGWRVHYVDSQELVAENGAAGNAFDGNPETIWHTQYRGSITPLPHGLQIDLGKVYAVKGFRYLPRQDGSANGRIAKYEFYVSTDGANWGSPAVAGTLANDAREKEVLFAAQPGRYVRLRALSEVAGREFTSMAELAVIGFKQ